MCGGHTSDHKNSPGAEGVQIFSEVSDIFITTPTGSMSTSLLLSKIIPVRWDNVFYQVNVLPYIPGSGAKVPPGENVRIFTFTPQPV